MATLVFQNELQFTLYNDTFAYNKYKPVFSTDRCKAVVPVFVLLFVALWFIHRGDSF